MKRFLGIILVALFAFAGVANPVGATEAQQYPFAVDVPAVIVSQGVPSFGEDFGFFGACDSQGLGCVGVSQKLISDGGSIYAQTLGLHVDGVICVRDYNAPCASSTGQPGTGVFIQNRQITYPRAEIVYPTVTVQTCVWQLDPRDTPRYCTDRIIRDIATAELPPVSVTVDDAGSDAESFASIVVPNGVVVHEPVIN